MSSKNPLYPHVDPLHPKPNSESNPSSSLYPSVDTSDLDNLFPDTNQSVPAVNEIILRIPGAMLHLIDKNRSVELSTGDFSFHRLTQGPNVVVMFASVSDPHHGNPDDDDDSIQWPVTYDTAAVKLDSSHYFFSLRVPDDNDNILLNFGLTVACNGQEALLTELDKLLKSYCNFSVHNVSTKVAELGVLDVSLVNQITAVHGVEEGPKKEMMEERTAAYWTMLAPNVEDYSGAVAKGIAKGSGHLIKGIIWCGDVTVERLKRGNEMMMKKIVPGEKAAEISPETLQRIKR